MVSVILLAVFCGLSLALLTFWTVGLCRVAQTARQVPTARAGLTLRRAATPSVCLVVPAHNEEAVIARHIESLRGQDYPALRVVLALDRCTDRTTEVARDAIGNDPRFSIVQVADCPPEWAGKVHAVWAGVAGSTDDVLAFADADTFLSPRCVSAAVALMEDRRLDFLSLVSTLTGRHWYERLVQPAAGFELMRQYPLVRANRDERRRPFANGQFMMFRADTYRAVGGHEAVKAELLEDLALARHVNRLGRRAGVFLADGVMTCRMYADWTAFRRGWKRIYTEAANRRARRLGSAARQTQWTGTLLPLSAFTLAGLATALVPDGQGLLRAGLVSLAVAALAVFLGTIAWIYRMSKAPLWTVPGYIIGAWIVGSILAEAAQELRRGTPTTWAGRSYVRDKR